MSIAVAPSPSRVLLGPANADHFRVKVGRFGDRWYCDPLPACPIAPADHDWHGPSITTTKPPFANKYVPMRATADMADTEWARLAATDPDTRYEAIKAHDKLTGRRNMARGSIIHQWAEDRLLGRTALFADPGGVPGALEQAEQYRPALDAFFDTHQPTLIAAEVVCLHRTLNGVGYGGTADCIVRIGGDTWVVDWKSRSSDHAAYLEEAAQGGGYCGAEYMIVTDHDTGQPVRRPLPDVAGVLIVSIRVDGYRVYPIDRPGAIEAYAEMHRWWTAQRAVADNHVIGRPWPPQAPTILDTVAPHGAHMAVSTPDLASTPDAGRAPSPTPPAVGEVERPTTPVVVVGSAPSAPANASGAEVEPDRREQLRQRYQRLSDDDKARFINIGVNPDDLDSVEAALYHVEPFNTVIPPIPPAATRPPMPPALPILADLDQGDTIPRSRLNQVRAEFAALPDADKQWVHRLLEQSRNAAVPIAPWPQADGTTRSLQLLTGLVALAFGPYGVDDQLAVEVAATAMNSDLPFLAESAGQAVGILDATRSVTFAVLCADVVTDPASVDLRPQPTEAT